VFRICQSGEVPFIDGEACRENDWYLRRRLDGLDEANHNRMFCSYMTVDCMDNSVVYGKELRGLPTSWELIDCHSSRRQRQGQDIIRKKIEGQTDNIINILDDHGILGKSDYHNLFDLSGVLDSPLCFCRSERLSVKSSNRAVE